MNRWIAAIATRWLIVVSVIALAAAGFIALADEVVGRETARLDDGVRRWVMLQHHPFLDAAFTLLTWLGSSVVLYPVAAVVAVVLWRRSSLRAAASTIVAPLGTIILINGLKLLFRRARPDGALAYPDLGYSFPSGHSTGSMAIAVTLTYVLVRERLVPAWSLGAAVVFGLLVGLSRVYLDVHWTTDVLGGWAVGMAIAAGSAGLYEWLRADPAERP